VGGAVGAPGRAARNVHRQPHRGARRAQTPQQERQIQEVRHHHIERATGRRPDLQIGKRVGHYAEERAHELEQRAVPGMQRREGDRILLQQLGQHRTSQGSGGALYSGLIFASRMTLLHFAPSARTKAANCSGVSPTTSEPVSSTCFLTSGALYALTISRCRVCITGWGVPAGAKRPFHTIASTPGRPASAVVGTSGSSARRDGPATASARSFPDLMCATITCGTTYAAEMVPDSRSGISALTPLYGTSSTLIPAWDLTHSPTSWLMLAGPPEP